MGCRFIHTADWHLDRVFGQVRDAGDAGHRAWLQRRRFEVLEIRVDAGQGDRLDHPGSGPTRLTRHPARRGPTRAAGGGYAEAPTAPTVTGSGPLHARHGPPGSQVIANGCSAAAAKHGGRRNSLARDKTSAHSASVGAPSRLKNARHRTS